MKHFAVLLLLFVLQSCSAAGVKEHVEPTGDIEFTWRLVPLGNFFVPVACVRNDEKCSALPKPLFEKMMSAGRTKPEIKTNVELHITDCAPGDGGRSNLLALCQRYAGSHRDEAAQ